jgi:hypothetical protein
MANDQDFLLSTEDNPYDPHTEYDKWYDYDEQHGHCTCGLIARLALSSIELGIEDDGLAYDDACERILSLNLPNNFIKVYKGKFKADSA